MLCGKTIFVFSSNTCISWSFLQLVTWAATVWNGDSWWVCCPVLWDDSSWLYLSCLRWLITLAFNFSHHFYTILHTFRWGPLCWNPCTGTSTVSSARENPEETEQLLQLTVNAPLELLFCKMIVFDFLFIYWLYSLYVQNNQLLLLLFFSYSLIKACSQWKEHDRPSLAEVRRKLQSGEKSANDSSVIRVPEPINIEQYLKEAGYGESNDYTVF